MGKFSIIRKALRGGAAKCLCVFAAAAVTLGAIPIITTAASEPVIGSALNAADFMTVMQDGRDITSDFKANPVINVAANQRGEFSNIYFTGDTYYYSADITVSSDTSSYGSIRTVLGTATVKGKKKYIELCVRPSLSGQYVFFMNGGGEDAVKVGGGLSVKIGDTYRITAQYAEGRVSYWVNGELLFDSVKMPNTAANIVLAPGFYSQNCTGTISNISIWGDIDEVKCPQYNPETDINLIHKVVVDNPVTGEAIKPTDGVLSYNGTQTVRTSFGGINYGGNSYLLSTTAKLFDNAAVDYEGLIFKIGTAKKGNTTYNIEIRPRENILVLFAFNNGESVIEIKGTVKTPLGSAQEYCVYYRSDNTFDFWINGSAVYYRLDLADFGFADIKPDVSLGGEVGSYEYTDIKLWGDKLEVISEPELDETSDTNVIPLLTINNPLTGESKECEDLAVSSSAAGATLKLLGAEYLGNFTFAANAQIHDNKNIAPWGVEYNFEGLLFNIGSSKKGDLKQTIQIRARRSGVIVFAVKEGGGEDVIYENYTVGAGYDTVKKYVVDYFEDGTFDLWINGSRIINRFDITSRGYEKLTPDFHIGGEVCTFDFTDMQLWGDIFVMRSPEFDAENHEDIITSAVISDPESGELHKLDDRAVSGTSGQRVTLLGLELAGDYSFWTTARFEDNKNMNGANEIDWEGLIFGAATATRDNEDYNIELRIRSGVVLAYAVKKSGGEEILLNKGFATPYGKDAEYVLEYKSGKLDLWQGNSKLVSDFDVSALGFENVKPQLHIGGEINAFSFSDMHLVNPGAEIAPGVPKKPEGNGDYSTITEVDVSSVVSYEGGSLICKDAVNAKSFFKYLPFTAADSYVFGADVTITKAEKSWQGPRFIVGLNEKGEEIAVFFTEYSFMVAEGSAVTYSYSFKRKLDKSYRLDFLVEEGSISLWVNGILLFGDIKTAAKVTPKTGVLFEGCAARVENLNLYHVNPSKFIVPEKPEKPVYKELGKGQYNAAEFAGVTLADKDYGGYFNCRLSSDGSAPRYMFKELPIEDSQSYYYSATFKVTESSANWKGPRFIFRTSDEVTMYLAVTQTSLLLLANGEVVASSPFKLELGREYAVVMYSTPNSFSAWLDKQLVFENVDLSKYSNSSPLRANIGLLFEVCKAIATNIAIYGDGIVFNPDFVDMELYNDSFYKMPGIPARPQSALNLFSGIKMQDKSEGSLGASYDDSTRSFKNDFSDTENGEISFVDANSSSNINGLKNETPYVFKFKYKPVSIGGEKPENSGIWFVANQSTAPFLTTENKVRIGVLGKSLEIEIYKNGELAAEQKSDFNLVAGKEYNIAVVHGRNWIKLYIDNELSLVSTNVPTYRLRFDFILNNIACEMSDFELYEMVDSGLQIASAPETVEVSRAGNTVLKTESHEIKPATNAPILLIAALLIVAAASGASAAYLIIKKIKEGKKEVEL